MRRIFKVPLDPSVGFEVQLPKGAHLLSVGAQNGRMFLWAKVDPEVSLVTRQFVVYGTGQVFEKGDDYLPFVGTVWIGTDPQFVFHVFDGGEI